jgi:hypothetical protein
LQILFLESASGGMELMASGWGHNSSIGRQLPQPLKERLPIVPAARGLRKNLGQAQFPYARPQ